MHCVSMVFFFKQKTAYEMRISDWSSDVCSSDLLEHAMAFGGNEVLQAVQQAGMAVRAHFGVAELAMIRPFDLAAQLGRHGLHAVAYAQHRNAGLEDLGRHFQRLFGIGRCVAARKYDAFQALLDRKSAEKG